MDSISFIQPDDFHVHFRDGAILSRVVPFTARDFGRAIVMPNLVPPVRNEEMAIAYRQRILAAVPADVRFEPLMTCYLTDETTPADLFSQGTNIFSAAKLYPAHATTNATYGVTAVENIYPTLEAMAAKGLPLLVHGEKLGPTIDVFDQEKAFIDDVLLAILDRVPKLKVVMEHITTEDGVNVVLANSTRMGATITPQHLLFDRNAIFRGGLRPHMYCLPILKRERHRQALRRAATSGHKCFFLGTDSAPHPRHLKECACGCAGVFSAPVAIAAYLQVFDEERALDKFEGFSSLNGAAFYGIAANKQKVTYVRKDVTQPDRWDVSGGSELVSLFAGESVQWARV